MHRRTPSVRLASLACAAVVAAACTSAPSSGPGSPAPSSSGATGWASPVGSTPVIPVLASPELAMGRDRFLFTLASQSGGVIADPSVTVHVRFFDLDKDTTQPATESDAVFFWLIEGQRGLYRVPVTFTAAGPWGAEFAIARTGAPPSGTGSGSQTRAPDPLASPVTVRMTFSVLTHPSVPAVGDPAPPVDTPTLASVGGDPKMISTDSDPDLRLYQLSVREALAAKKPFLLYFGTPAFCQTATCGPTLKVVRQVLADFPTLTAIHVEPYQMVFKDGALKLVVDATGNPQPIAAVETWGLPTEPYTFLIDANGKIADRFAGPIDPPELHDAIQALLATA